MFNKIIMPSINLMPKQALNPHIQSLSYLQKAVQSLQNSTNGNNTLLSRKIIQNATKNLVGIKFDEYTAKQSRQKFLPELIITETRGMALHSKQNGGMPEVEDTPLLSANQLRKLTKNIIGKKRNKGNSSAYLPQTKHRTFAKEVLSQNTNNTPAHSNKSKNMEQIVQEYQIQEAKNDRLKFKEKAEKRKLMKEEALQYLKQNHTADIEKFNEDYKPNNDRYGWYYITDYYNK